MPGRIFGTIMWCCLAWCIMGDFVISTVKAGKGGLKCYSALIMKHKQSDFMYELYVKPLFLQLICAVFTRTVLRMIDALNVTICRTFFTNILDITCDHLPKRGFTNNSFITCNNLHKNSFTYDAHVECNNIHFLRMVFKNSALHVTIYIMIFERFTHEM